MEACKVENAILMKLETPLYLAAEFFIWKRII